MNTEQYDAIVVGSGAGGSAAAFRLVCAGKRVLLVEKGGPLPRDGSTLDLDRVLHQGAFKSREPWADGRGRRIVPEEYFNLGGKTKWYGAALLRFAEHEFRAEPGYQCPAWPLAYSDLAPYYDEVEQLLDVRVFDCEPELKAIVRRFTANGSPWHELPLPMGLAANIVHHPEEAAHFDGFASVKQLKADAEISLLGRARQNPNLILITGQAVTRLLPAEQDPLRIGGIVTADGRRFQASAVLLGAGALHSPRLLQRYLAEQCLAATLPVAAQVGRNLKLHLLTALIAVSFTRKHDLLRKTTALLCDELPHSSVQPLGFDGEMIANLIPRIAPRWVARQVGARAYGFFLQTEDGSHPDNRVHEAAPGNGTLPRMDYDAHRLRPALREHRALVRAMHLRLLAAGFVSFSQRIGIEGTAHACGTMAAGTGPENSVVNRDGSVHGLSGLYVVDGSVLTRSSRVNPSLTIYAWGLRVADRLLEKHP